MSNRHQISLFLQAIKQQYNSIINSSSQNPTDRFSNRATNVTEERSWVPTTNVEAKEYSFQHNIE